MRAAGQENHLTIVNNSQIGGMLRSRYSLHEVRAIKGFLDEMGTFLFDPLPNGLFPAASLRGELDYTGYSHVWIRDNIHVAHSMYKLGFADAAVRNVRALIGYFSKYQRRLTDIIDGVADPSVPMNRPHIKFDGRSLEELSEKWPHAQNDALGYFLWLFCKLAEEGALVPGVEELGILGLFPRYFEAVRYWQDEDSGHWEETRKISASSIGVVMAGLTELQKLSKRTGPLRDHHGGLIAVNAVEALVERGRTALAAILPSECIQEDPWKRRRYDAALLFLVFPLQILPGQMADRIAGEVLHHLQGDFGIRRYLGDSYWAPDYKKKLDPAERTADVSDDVSARNRLLPSIGQEAQWCIFDPIVSCIFGLKFKSTGLPEYLTAQIEYLNRSLGQITAVDLQGVQGFRCPELYYLEGGRYVPNDHVPLLWTQANLMLALKFMEDNCAP